MSNISSSVDSLLDEYARIYTEVNAGTQPVRIFPGKEQLIAQFRAISNATEADGFFDNFTVGNAVERVHRPFERLSAYELLLTILQQLDATKYNGIHKGTPYYFIGWTAFQFFSFSKAMFYMDAAVSEDLKFPDVQSKASTSASLQFFLLTKQSGPTGLPAHIELSDLIEKTLRGYHTSGGGAITIDEFRTRFVDNLLYSGPRERSVLTAFYTFILEYEQRQREIMLRSDTGGSIQPFLDHLFDGARILESLLEKRGGAGSTLWPKITGAPLLAVNQSVLKGNQTLLHAEQEYNHLLSASSSFQDRNFAAAYIIRNTTGHSLLWPDQFASNNSYQVLYNSLINSILWTIQKLWL